MPNAVTALALCSGLFGIRYGIDGEWRNAAAAIAIAALLDGLDGRIARLLNGASRFGAELDSLSDVTAFGVAPALIIYQWVLEPLGPGELLGFWTGWGWLFALAYAACAALRLARFNANIDADDQPHKSAGYLTGVPAPAGAGRRGRENGSRGAVAGRRRRRRGVLAGRVLGDRASRLDAARRPRRYHMAGCDPVSWQGHLAAILWPGRRHRGLAPQAYARAATGSRQ